MYICVYIYGVGSLRVKANLVQKKKLRRIKKRIGGPFRNAKKPEMVEMGTNWSSLVLCQTSRDAFRLGSKLRGVGGTAFCNGKNLLGKTGLEK